MGKRETFDRAAKILMDNEMTSFIVGNTEDGDMGIGFGGNAGDLVALIAQGLAKLAESTPGGGAAMLVDIFKCAVTLTGDATIVEIKPEV